MTHLFLGARRIDLVRNIYVVLVLLASAPLPTVSAEVPLTGHEAAGQAAEDAGRFEEAFREYLQAFRALPEPPPAAADARLRERIIRVVPRLGTPPTLSEEAEQHYMKAQSLVEAQEMLGTAEDTDALKAAAAGFRKAVRAAPWWSDPLVALAKRQQQLKRYDEAAENLRLYRLAQSAPVSPPVVEQPAAASDPVVATAATIYVYWPPQFGARSMTLECDGRVVAKLSSRRFIVLRAVPGAHTFTFWKRSTSGVFEAGQEHYLRISAGGFPAHGNFRFVAREEATAEMGDKRMTPNDPKDTFNDECEAPPVAPTKRSEGPLRWPASS